jgi:sulfur dioxygenase
MIFHQLFDPASSTYTYILADATSLDAVIIDPVLEQRERDLAVLQAGNLKLQWIIDTHVHADHVTGANALKAATGALTAVGEACRAVGYDRDLHHGDTIAFGCERLDALATPGHTPGSMSFVGRDRVFTGDTLLIGGCGRADFQNGDAHALYTSITQKLFALPDATIVYPAHDYNGHTASTIGNERAANPRLAGHSEEDFVALMAALNLPRPKRIDEAVPLNRIGGLVNEHDTPWLSVPVTSVPQALRSDRALLIDLRDAADCEQGKAPGAVRVTHDDYPHMAALAAGCDHLYLICRTGKRSMLAARELAARGVRNAVNIAGGMQAWRDAGLPLTVTNKQTEKQT